MTNKKPKRKRRGRSLALLLFGVCVGAGLGYVLVEWRRALEPEGQPTPGPEGVSIYEVSGDETRDWPPGSGADGSADADPKAETGGSTAEPLGDGRSPSGGPLGPKGGLSLWS